MAHIPWNGFAFVFSHSSVHGCTRPSFISFDFLDASFWSFLNPRVVVVALALGAGVG